jgi:outer membrane protein assembly factor BamB
MRLQHPRRIATILVIAFHALASIAEARGEDWPTFRHDQRRSGVTGESVDAARLKPAWTWKSALPPSPAWPDAARWDAYAVLDGLKSMRNYDPVYHPVVVGDSVYLPGNSDDTLRCLDIRSGLLSWQFTADAPIRIAPTVHDERIYFGSDDGCVYAVTKGGNLIWKTAAQTSRDSFINDGRVCSFWPIRTGVLVDADRGVGIVSAGMFPWLGTHLVALNLENGTVAWRRELGKSWTLEGAMLLSAKHIIAPQGRAAPQLFDSATGEPIGPLLEGGGGSFVLLTDADEVLHGPGNKGGWITQSSLDSREKVASFERGTAVIVDGQCSYLLDNDRLAAMDRGDGGILWAVDCGCPHEMIKADDTLFVGGFDEVRGYAADTGKLLWVAAVEGRAMGLAAANGHLFVSTDTGALHAFAADGEPQHHDTANEPAADMTPAPEPAAVDDPHLLDRWVFHADRVVALGPKKKDLRVRSLVAGGNLGNDAPLSKNAKFAQAGREQALVLDGRTECRIADDYKTVLRPTDAITAIAWVRIDKPIAWGGIISMMQDNGNFEKGWILGYQQDRFGFAVNGTEGPDELTWVVSDDSAFVPGAWHLVAGTYDGQATKLYVDGGLVAQSDKQQGELQYPPAAVYQVGSYQDDDEHFISEGMLNEVRMYDRAVTAPEIAAIYQEKADRFPEPATEFELASRSSYIGKVESTIDAGPVIDFITAGTARVRWWTRETQETRIELQDHPYSAATARVESADGATREHVAMIHPIRPHELVKFRILHQVDGQTHQTGLFECDGHCDFSRPDLPPENLPAETLEVAKRFADAASLDEPRGLGIVLGAGDGGRFAEAIARVAGVDVVVIESDAQRVDMARRRMIESGVYGRAVSVRHVQNPDDIGLPARTADFIFAAYESNAGGLADHVSLDELIAKLQPGGQAILAPGWWPEESLSESGFVSIGDDRVAGAGDAPGDAAAKTADDDSRATENVLVGWRYISRQVAGAAPWTHMYGTGDNSAYAGETLSGVSSQDGLAVAWAGRPGPRYQSDRGNRKPSPLAASGRLFMQGLRRVISLDAYNGTILWSLELPEVVRFNVPRDCSNWCADEKFLYIAAKGRCYVIDAATGELVDRRDVYDPDGRDFDWGFLAREQDLVIGSGVAKETAFTDFWGGEHWYDSKDGEHAKKVCSDILFAAYQSTGDMAWRFEDGLVVNPTITLADGKVFFLVSRSEKLRQAKDRRLDGEEFWTNMHMVSLDAKTGEKLWDVPVKPLEGVSATYLAAADGKLLLTTSKEGVFGVYAIDMATGKPIWRGKFDWEVDHHGKHLSRPAIVHGKVYLRPLTLDLETGKVLSQKFPDGHQCGTYTASRDALFLRAGELAIWDRNSGEATRWDRARPDCWISTIPALGMLLSPEGGGGCSCGGWIETSIGFAPVSFGNPQRVKP